jgi:polysaccharide chain length determinant protein (PEP-CTERM system associated)
MNAEAGLQLSDLAGIVRRRVAVMGGVALAVFLVFYWVAMALPNEYESYATVLVEPQSVAPELVKAGVRESDLNERLHLMTAEILSRPRLSRLIDDLHLYEDESQYLLREEVISMMRDNLRVEPVIPELETGRFRPEYEINQFQIHFRDDDARVARNVAQALADDFIEEHIDARVKLSQKSLEFVDAERTRLAERIAGVENQIKQVKADNAGKLPEDVPSNQQQLARLGAELADARRRLALARSDETFFRSQSNTARELSVGVDDANPERRIQLLELALKDFNARGYTEKHPDVIKSKLELEQVRALVEERRKVASERDPADAPATFAQQNAEAEAQRAGLRRESEAGEIEQLEGAVARVEARLAETPAVAEQLGALEREYRHLFASYQEFSDKRLNASVQADLERRQLGEQFRVLEQAFEGLGPVSPNRLLIIALGTIFGLALGAAVGVLLEAVDPAVHDAHGLQASLRIPVLASIPQIWLEADRARMRRRRLRAVFATAAVVGFALVGGAANYVWVNGSPMAVPQAPEGAAPPPTASAPEPPALPAPELPALPGPELPAPEPAAAVEP